MTTINRPVALEDTMHPGRITRLVITQGHNHTTAVPLTHDELQAIVQAAYDQYDIVPTPDYGKEADVYAIEDARDVSDQADYLAAHDPAQTTIEEQISAAESGELHQIMQADALRAKLTGEVR